MQESSPPTPGSEPGQQREAEAREMGNALTPAVTTPQQTNASGSTESPQVGNCVHKKVLKHGSVCLSPDLFEIIN